MIRTLKCCVILGLAGKYSWCSALRITIQNEDDYWFDLASLFQKNRLYSTRNMSWIMDFSKHVTLI